MTDRASELRPLTADERDEVARLEAARRAKDAAARRGCAPACAIICGAFTAIGAGALWDALSRWLGEAAVMDALGGPLVAIATGGLLGVVVGLWAERALARDDGLPDDLERGEVQVRRFAARAAVRAPDLEYEETLSPAFFLDVGDGRVLLLGGEHLRGAVEAGRFPARAVEVRLLPLSGWRLPVSCAGEPLPAGTAPPLAELVALDRDLERLVDGALFPGRLETLRDDLERWLKAPTGA